VNLRSASGTLVLGILAIAVLVVASWLLLISPVLGKTSDANDAIEAAQDRNLLMTSQVTALETQQQNLSRYEDTADELAELFPPTADQPGFFAAVVEAADRAGIPADQVTALSPSAPQLLGPDGQPLSPDEVAAQGTDSPEVTDVAEQTVQVTAEASYSQAQQLLANLERMDRAFVVTALSVDDGNSDGDGEGFAPATLTVSITGSTYVASPLTEVEESPSSTSAAG
jgi:hypothetical protein